MIRTDVLVVGGGPAGSTAAAACSRLGLDVTVADRARFPRDKVCAGWITPAVVEALELELEDYAAERVLQPIRSFRIGVLGGRETATRRGERPVSWGIRRCEFDDYLLRRAGARLLLGAPLAELRRDGEDWVAEIGDETVRARLVIGAGGHFCPVARRLGARVGKGEAAVLAQEVEFEATGLDAAPAADEPLLLFCADLRGYGWIFRKGNWFNVGLGRDDPDRLSEHVAGFRARMRRDGRIPEETPERFKGHAYRLWSHPPRTPVDDGVLLVGDAAGLAYAQSGEGIRPAVESALLAARTIAGARGDFGAARLGGYVEALERRFGPRGRPGGAAWLPGGLRRALARDLLGREWFARRVVLDRWFLHRDQPALATR